VRTLSRVQSQEILRSLVVIVEEMTLVDQLSKWIVIVKKYR
jgi:hypothetical protein